MRLGTKWEKGGGDAVSLAPGHGLDVLGAPSAGPHIGLVPAADPIYSVSSRPGEGQFLLARSVSL